MNVLCYTCTREHAMHVIHVYIYIHIYIYNLNVNRSTISSKIMTEVLFAQLYILALYHPKIVTEVLFAQM